MQPDAAAECGLCLGKRGGVIDHEFVCFGKLGQQRRKRRLPPAQQFRHLIARGEFLLGGIEFHRHRGGFVGARRFGHPDDDGLALARLGVARHVFAAEKRRPRIPDINQHRWHVRPQGDHPPGMQISRPRGAVRPHQAQRLQFAVLDQRRPDFAGRQRQQQSARHGARRRARSKPNPASNEAVSNSGRPTMFE